MTNYYYSKNPDVIHDQQEWDFNLRGQAMTFVTDNGVFSKRTVDFGTRTLLATFDFATVPAGPLLDVGAGYGPIGLTLAKEQPQRHVDLVDVNELALSLAQENAQRNQLSNVTIFTSDQYAAVKDQYAAILTNPPIRAGKKVVHGILSGAFDHLLAGGVLTVVIQKKQGAPSAQQKMNEVFGNVTVLAKNKGYFILQSRK
ncbi:class I SAM-dependent methyltransferase [Loigolactobacillus binensis]|uniref:Class I SAM-dependent methyltransferase n=1 Tax=Loigolactobacillus binensis TaxID=2559922 RepID=A0ABW3EB95_9LACO|nr:class I SAM-dependent methyltransferase [Loigolactobacillus binensis]